MSKQSENLNRYNKITEEAKDFIMKEAFDVLWEDSKADVSPLIERYNKFEEGARALYNIKEDKGND